MRETIIVGMGIALLFFSACDTDPGQFPIPKSQSGNIVVSGGLDADIFLDYRPTGMKTPAILENIPVGTHVVHIFLPEKAVTPDSAVVDLQDQETQNVTFQVTPAVFGHLNVTSSPAGSSVYLDGVRFGYTPVLISGLPVRDYRLTIRRSGCEEINRTISITGGNQIQFTENLAVRGRNPIIEHFSNSGCIPCVAVDSSIEKIFHEVGVDYRTAVSYHADYPSPDDPMYLLAQSDNDARDAYYAPPSMPSIYVDGIRLLYSTIPALETNLRGKIATNKSLPAPILIDIRETNQVWEDTLKGEIRITALSDLTGNYVLRVAFIEHAVHYDSPPGVNGQTSFSDVLRKLYPSPAGIPVTLPSGGEMLQTYSLPRLPEWGRQIGIVAFVQNETDKSVVQSAWTIYP